MRVAAPGHLARRALRPANGQQLSFRNDPSCRRRRTRWAAPMAALPPMRTASSRCVSQM